MPTYTYQCAVCHTKAFVARKIEDRDTLPTRCLCEKPDYKRIIDSPPAAARGENWGSKGNW